MQDEGDACEEEDAGDDEESLNEKAGQYENLKIHFE